MQISHFLLRWKFSCSCVRWKEKKQHFFFFEMNLSRFMCNGVAKILPFLVYCRKQKKNLVSRCICV